MESPGEADRIVLYEIYDDRAAFDAHLKTAHFASFNEASAALVADKKVTELRSGLRRIGGLKSPVFDKKSRGGYDG